MKRRIILLFALLLSGAVLTLSFGQGPGTNPGAASTIRTRTSDPTGCQGNLYLRSTDGALRTCFNGGWNSTGGGGAAATVTLLTKSASYAGVAGDFSGASTPPSEVVFTLTAQNQTYTLPSTAPALVSGNMPCVIVMNSRASGTFYAQILTGGSTTLDGLAYAAVPGYPLQAGASVHVCSDGTNYRLDPGNRNDLVDGVSFEVLPFGYIGTNSTLVGAASTPNVIKINLKHTQKVSHLQFLVNVGQAAAVCDVGIYDTSLNLITHISGGVACTAAGDVGAAASPTVILPPGNYWLAGCSSNTTVSLRAVADGNFEGMVQDSSSLVIGTAASGCTTGVLQATLGTITNTNNTSPPVVVLGN